jgi:SAM-dependent methyltransferase
VFFMRGLDKDWPDAKPDIQLQLRVASASDLSLLVDGYHRFTSEAALKERFERGDLCFIALDRGGRLAHARWLTTKRCRIAELCMDILLRPGEAYFYDGYTRPEMRGRGVDGAVRCFIFGWLRAAGFKKIYSYVRGDNPVGLRAARRRQQPIGKLRYLRLRALRPWVLGAYGSGFPLLVRNGPASEEARREKASRAWFESWLGKPLSKRSTGYHGMPEGYFASTADFISEALRLDPHGDSVLDVGCDSAMVTRLVARRCRRLVGVDFIPGMLADIPLDIADRQSHKSISFVAADGRLLPFRSDLFPKVYCCAVIHTLASREHGLRMVHELIRVCQPGGEVLVASIPDTAKRLYALLEKWRQADDLLGKLRLLLSFLLGKLRLLLSLALPRPLKNLVRSILGLERGDGPSFLDYDVGALKRQFEAEGLECQIVQFPESYWKRDFRRTRSNLLLRKPSRAKSKSLGWQLPPRSKG